MVKTFITISIIAIIIAGALFVNYLKAKPSSTHKIYDFKANQLGGGEVSLSQYKGKALLIVNVASECGYTPHYEGLQALYKKYHDQGFEVLAFPCNQFGGQEPGTAEQIKNFCTSKYSVTFPMFDKIEVNGPNAHPLYKYLVKEVPGFITDSIKWNFTKFLIGKDGTPIKRYAHKTKPEEIAPDIENALK